MCKEKKCFEFRGFRFVVRVMGGLRGVRLARLAHWAGIGRRIW